MATHADPACAAFARLLAAEPGAIACASPSRTATRATVDALATSLRAVIATCGAPGEPVGLTAPNGPAFLGGYLALRRACRPVLLLDAARPTAERLASARAMGACGVLETEDAWANEAAAFRMSACVPEARAPLMEVAAIKLTSGSTGAPTGVALSGEALLADEDALARTMGIAGGDRILAAIPMSHSYGLSSLALPALVRGCLLALADDGSPFASLAAASHAGATVFPTAPAWLDAFVRIGRRPEWPRSIRLVVSASAPLPPAVAARFRDVTGLPVRVFYGASEAGGITYDREGSSGERGSVGTPVEDVRVELEPLPGWDDGQGRVVVSGPALASRCIPPGDDRLAGGRFRTSDVASWRDGELVLHGRIDGLLNVKGWKVSPRELEVAIGALAGVQEVVVMGVPDPEGKGRTLIHALVAGSGGVTIADVTAHCRATLPLRAVPHRVVVVSEIPRTTLGKLDRASALRLLGDPR